MDFARSYVGSIGANEDVENTIENFPQRGARKAIQICKSELEAVKQKKSKKMEVRLALIKGNNFLTPLSDFLLGTIRQTVPQSLNKNKKERVNFSTSLSFRPTER